MGDIYVDDVDKTAAAVKELGGAIKHGPGDIPDVGRFAVAADPHGAIFVLLKWAQPMGNGVAAPGTPGYTGWRELFAGNLAEAFAFYAKLFGWTKADALDMGPMGTYQLFAHRGETIGGMMNKPAQLPAPAWNYYFNVDSVKAAIERIKRGGGEVLMGPMQVPGGSWIIQGRDPQQATFALVSEGE
jgi:predicted enzyme related to lactoylglutathione lyase